VGFLLFFYSLGFVFSSGFSVFSLGFCLKSSLTAPQRDQPIATALFFFMLLQLFVKLFSSFDFFLFLFACLWFFVDNVNACY